jgi:energy-coupling factor transporter ATP-binding protein EcfA2
MIKTIELKNFKNHLDTKITLDDSNLHALVGPNSSGKTTVLQALYYLSLLREIPYDKVFRGERDPKYLITLGNKESQVSVSGLLEKRHNDWSVSLRWKTNPNGHLVPIAQWITNGDSNGTDGLEITIPALIRTSLNHTAYLKLSAEKLAQAAYSEEVAPKIGYDGNGLAPFLDSLKNEAPVKFKELEQFLRQIVPGVREIGIRRAIVPVNQRRSIEINGQVVPYEETKEVTGQEVIFNMISGERIPAHAMSEGTIIALGLLAVVLSPNRPNLLLIDDIAQGLHPNAQLELIKVLKKIPQMNPGLQIIFTTHSPYIIDELEPSQVHVLNTTPEGYAVVRRMDEHPDVQRGLQVLTPGEFWDAEGEEWILAGETSG